jgi:putative transposase
MATVSKSYRIRAYPNGAQQRMLDRWFGAARWLWNTALEIRSAAYQELRLSLTGVDISKWLTQWKRTAGHEWLADVPATCLVQCLLDQDKAFANFFRDLEKPAKKRRFFYPTSKPKRTSGSLRFQDVGRAWRWGELSLPKLGPIKLAEGLPRIPGEEPDRAFIAKPDMVTLSRDAAGRYFVSFSTEVEIEALPATGHAVGVDLGLKHLATLSTGEKIEAPKHYLRSLKKLRQQQRALTRKRKDSNRRSKQKRRVAKIHAHAAAQRDAAVHQLTTRLIRENDLVAIEDLNVRAMKRGMLSRSMQDASFGEFRRQLQYKASWYGRTVFVVDRYFPSSKTCSCCGHMLDELRLDVREWTCPKCGTVHDRDVTAAVNVLVEAIHQLSGGDTRRYLRADGEGACPAAMPAQVSPREARSGQQSWEAQLAARSMNPPWTQLTSISLA